MASTSLSLLIALVLASATVPVSGNEFLKAPKVIVESVSEQDIRTSLLDEVEATLGSGSASNRLSDIEAMLRPIVAALPKNEHGKLGHAGVGYALHRLFVQRHGWVIQGLDSKGGTWASSSPSGVLKDQVPAYIEGLFEQRLAGKGFGLKEVAILASTIEHLIHNEAVSKLGNAFNLHDLPFTVPLGGDDASVVLDTYMMSYILGERIQNLTLPMAQAIIRRMPEIFLAWQDTQKFVRGVQENVTNNAEEVDFASLARVVEVVGEHFGSFQDMECRQLKDKLMNMEYRGTGRVRLADFYKPALDGAWTFQESSGYLRSLGILDETDPNQPSVMIANYVTSQANCIASSGFYSVCCKNECEGLLGHIEQHIGTSEATPATIASLIEELPSSTVAAQKVSANLQQRLHDIASNHHGMVPLHGRLFAQWMHHIYPRECPYPHITGTADSKLPEEFTAENGHDAGATQEEMMQFIALSDNTTDSQAKYDLPVEELMPWSSEEELFVVRPLGHAPWDSTASTTPAKRSMVLFAAAGSLGFGLIQALKTATPLGMGEAVPKYTV